MYSALEAPFERYKLDTAVPFMKTLIKLETAGSKLFSIVMFVQAFTRLYQQQHNW